LKICLTGKARSGKDTCGDWLVQKHGFKKFAFADSLKEICFKLFPKEFENGKPRRLLQKVAVLMKKIDKCVWVDYCFREIEKNTTHQDNIVITDLRRKEQLKKVLEEGFYIVKIESRQKNRIKRLRKLKDNFKLSDLNDESETILEHFPYDFLVINDGSFKDLFVQIDKIVKKIEENDH
jgi:dephospho-CoA kinase